MSVSALGEALEESGRDTALRDVTARMSEQGVRHVYLQYTAVPGRVMGKVVPATHFERIARNGLPWTYLSAGGFTVDVGGNVLGPSSAACAEGLLIPDLDTFRVLPWDTEMGRVFCDHFHGPDDPERPGALAEGDSRANLKRAHAEFEAELGLALQSGCEPEMSWFPDADSITASISSTKARADWFSRRCSRTTRSMSRAATKTSWC